MRGCLSLYPQLPSVVICNRKSAVLSMRKVAIAISLALFDDIANKTCLETKCTVYYLSMLLCHIFQVANIVDDSLLNKI